MKKKLAFILICLAILGCKNKEVQGIIIGDTLLVLQSYSENKELCHLIERALNKDSEALVGLINFPCGGAAGCYDVGYIVSQLVYRIGEHEFIQMTSKLTKQQQIEIRNYIEVGLEYGHNNLKIEHEFPELDKILKG